MNKYHNELTQREKDMLKLRRDSDTKATELVKMEKMLEQTKNLLDKKTESPLDSKGYQENMGVYLKRNISPCFSCFCEFKSPISQLVVACDCVFWLLCHSGGPGGKSALQPTVQEKLPPSHADAGEPDEDGQGRVGGHSGPPAGAEERPASLAAESRGAQSCHGEAGSRAQVNPPLACCFRLNRGFNNLFKLRDAN